jgi:hypothetical protein
MKIDIEVTIKPDGEIRWVISNDQGLAFEPMGFTTERDNGSVDIVAGTVFLGAAFQTVPTTRKRRTHITNG